MVKMEENQGKTRKKKRLWLFDADRMLNEQQKKKKEKKKKKKSKKNKSNSKRSINRILFLTLFHIKKAKKYKRNEIGKKIQGPPSNVFLFCQLEHIS